MGQLESVGLPEPLTGARAARREPDDDFFCLRFQVWYPSFDCAIRTKYRTCSGCLDCEQGRFNLERHRRALTQLRSAPYRRD